MGLAVSEFRSDVLRRRCADARAPLEKRVWLLSGARASPSCAG